MITSIKLEHEEIHEGTVFVGRDMLELLSSAMYVNPLSIFREYIQNATDAIDDAEEAGLLPTVDSGVIEVNLDHINRRVVIRDNGKGLSNKDFVARMLSFGASEKRGTNARGFRGIGRLSGLGYAQQLIFSSQSEGDTQVVKATWDGHVVKRMLADADSSIDLQRLVKEVVTFEWTKADDVSTHFFEVELVKPRRIANDRLLNEVEVESYISQVCPCPFSPEFSFGDQIATFLAPYGSAGKTYRIQVNGKLEPVYRPYRNTIKYSDTKRATVTNLKTFEVNSVRGDGAAAVGWLVHHEYQGAIPVAQGVRGLRVRMGNIQVGDDRLFSETFPEDRFCSWAVGEVHILDESVIPNGRRDGFESNVHLDNVLMHLRPISGEVARKCRLFSQRRNRLKSFELAADKVNEKLDFLKQGAISERMAKSFRAEIGAQLSELRKLIQFDLFEESERQALECRLAAVEMDVQVQSSLTEGEILEKLPACKRIIYKEVFDLIYECSNNQVAAKSLVDRILARLSLS